MMVVHTLRAKVISFYIRLMEWTRFGARVVRRAGLSHLITRSFSFVPRIFAPFNECASEDTRSLSGSPGCPLPSTCRFHTNAITLRMFGPLVMIMASLGGVQIYSA
jgi:hypothetical protein